MPPSRMGDDGAQRPGRQIAAWGAGGIVLALVLVIVFALAFGGNGGGSTSSGPPPPPDTVAASTVGPGPPSQPAPSGVAVGVSVNRLFNDLGPMARLRSTSAKRGPPDPGATSVASDALWEIAEPAPPVRGVHHWDWSFDDEIAAALATSGSPLVAHSSTTARPGRSRAPAGLTHHPSPRLARRSSRLSRRVRGPLRQRRHVLGPPTPRCRPNRCDIYEVWNEPDNRDVLDFPPRTPDPLRTIALPGGPNAILATDPTARVIVGGLTDLGAFLPALVRTDPALVGHVDGVAIHPYGATPLAVLGRVRDARPDPARARDVIVPLYVTEFGWTTSPPGRSASRRLPGDRTTSIARSLRSATPTATSLRSFSTRG